MLSGILSLSLVAIKPVLMAELCVTIRVFGPVLHNVPSGCFCTNISISLYLRQTYLPTYTVELFLSSEKDITLCWPLQHSKN